MYTLPDLVRPSFASSDEHGSPRPTRNSGVRRVGAGPAASPDGALRVLIIEGDGPLRSVLAEHLPRAYRHRVVTSLGEAREVMAEAPVFYEGIIADTGAEGGEVLEWVGRLRYQGWKGHVLVSSADPSARLDRLAARVGAGFVRKTRNHLHSAAKFRFFLHKVALGSSLRTRLREYGEAFDLTRVEQRVLDLAPWIPAQLICETLGTTLLAVEEHERSIVRKTGVGDLSAALLMASGYGQVDAYREAAGLVVAGGEAAACPRMQRGPREEPSMRLPALLFVGPSIPASWVQAATLEGLRAARQPVLGGAPRRLACGEERVVGVVLSLGAISQDAALSFAKALRALDKDVPVLCLGPPVVGAGRTRLLRERVKLIDPDSGERAGEIATGRFARYAVVGPGARRAILDGFCERHRLTNMHRRVLSARWEAFTREELPAVLGVGKSTVRTHLDDIRHRVGGAKRFEDVLRELSLHAASIVARQIACRGEP